MNTMRYEPWLMVNDFNRELDRLTRARQQEPANPANNWTPTVDIREEKDRFCLSMDLPGVDPKAIEVSMEKGVLVVSGERKALEVKVDEQSYHRQERAQGAFNRRFKLPESADAAEITAKSEHGVLEVVIKKRAEQLPRRITITH
ncbi:MAG: Hsp20/alpha crystallin family protein [Pseudomonadota bacterium]